MRILTKERFADLEFHNLIVILETNCDKKIPFVFTNGGEECVAKEDLYTVKTNLNVTAKENEINFIMLPYAYDLEIDRIEGGAEISEQTYRNDFLLQYLNRLRVISNIPDGILRLVKDKRLLALGYAEKQAKKEILGYIKSKYKHAFDLFEKCCEASVKAEEGLTIRKQFKKHNYIQSVPNLFDGVDITKAETVNDEIYLTLDNYITVVFSGAEIIEEETDIVDSCVCGIELYKKESFHELHFLIMKRDENLIEHYHYVTYAFKDLKFRN